MAASEEQALDSITKLTCIAIVAALLVHQIFRKYETYSIPVHVSLLCGPPVLTAAYIASTQHSLPIGSALLRSWGVYYSALIVSVVAYRLSPWHPLAHYPGPLLFRTSNIWQAFFSTTGERSRYYKALHERHGDFIRIGPNELSIRDPAAIVPLLGASGMPKGTMFIGSFLKVDVPMIGIQDIEEHLRRRRPWNRGLGQAAVKEYEHHVAARTRQLIDILEEKREKLILGHWFDYLFYDVMSDMAFGGGSELMRDGDTHGVWTILQQGAKAAQFLTHLPWLGIYVGYLPAASGPLNVFLSLGQQSAARRLSRGSTRPDLFHYLNNEDIPGGVPPPEKQLVDDGILAVVGGSDTAASALTSLFYCLMTNPETYALLQEEIDKCYPQGEDALDTKYHRDMSYLQAVINESLRLHPPLMTGGSRRVAPDGKGMIVGSSYLPPGTTIYIPPYSLQRDERNFSFPDAFWPERWLVASGQLPIEKARLPSALKGSLDDFKFMHNETAYIPFSYGPMNCVGKGLAMLELRMVICALVQRFRFRLADGWDPREYDANYKDYYVSTRPEVPVVLVPRW